MALQERFAVGEGAELAGAWEAVQVESTARVGPGSGTCPGEAEEQPGACAARAE